MKGAPAKGRKIDSIETTFTKDGEKNFCKPFSKKLGDAETSSA
jgi:hypothetical protein